MLIYSHLMLALPFRKLIFWPSITVLFDASRYNCLGSAFLPISRNRRFFFDKEVLPESRVYVKKIFYLAFQWRSLPPPSPPQVTLKHSKRNPVQWMTLTTDRPTAGPPQPAPSRPAPPHHRHHLIPHGYTNQTSGRLQSWPAEPQQQRQIANQPASTKFRQNKIGQLFISMGAALPPPPAPKETYYISGSSCILACTAWCNDDQRISWLLLLLPAPLPC